MSEVVVSATRAKAIGIMSEQTAPKSRITLSGDYLQKQTAGDTLFNSLNQLPGVSFTSTDAFGTSGGNLRIRGFDGSRVSVTFDGIPLNDSGNYALFPNQMLDPELIDRIDVNLGTTDVDSPTASATGGAVAYRTRRPQEEFGGQSTLSVGEDNYRRAFVRVDSGDFGPWGTKAFVSASYQNYDKFKGPGELEKKQFNAAIRQDFENENFIQIAAHYNENRNAFYKQVTAANIAAFGREYEQLVSCTRDTPTGGVVDNENRNNVVAPTPPFGANDLLANPSSCTNYYGVRINPSDTGNIRMQSLWHLGEKLRLTFDPSWQYTLANGGGTTTINETVGTGNNRDVRVIGNANVPGFDLNGDGDILDTVRYYTPNNTNTRRWVATTSLIYDINDNHRVRLAYTWDRARHRQTAQWGYIEGDGPVENVFGGRKGERVYAADGDIIRGRDRFSIAELKQFALEWRGQFLEDKFVATVGVRAPEFTRELNQYCYTPNGGTGSSSTSFASSTLCTSREPSQTLANGNVIFQTNPTGAIQYIRPYSEEVKFDDVLPNVGLSFTPWDRHSFYLSYAEGLSAPRTDNLYSVVRLSDNSVGRPTPESETTKAYDLGWRYNGENLLASVAVWKIDYTDRIVSSFNPDLGFSVDRNVGDVKLDGFEAQVGRQFGVFSLNASVGYTHSELLENLPNSQITIPVTGEVQNVVVPLKGKELVETPRWTYAMRADFDFSENFNIGLEGKKTSTRFATDLNNEETPGYTVLDLDVSYGFHLPGFKKAQVQLTVSNLTDEEYLGNISSGIGGTPGQPVTCLNETTGASVNCVNQNGSLGLFTIGAPRTAVLSVKFDF